MTTRRDFLEHSGLAALGLSLPLTRRLVQRTQLDLHRPPDAVFAETPSGLQPLAPKANHRWAAESITVTTEPVAGAVRIALSAPSTPVRRLHLRWRGTIAGNPLILGDAWERGYGDLEWRGWVPDRVMPWYVATHDGALTHCYGVQTGPAALCFWQVDPHGLSLWADVRSGTVGVELGSRELELCSVISRPGRAGETAFAAIHAFCRQMCPAPRLPALPVYGSNDWYWAYGNNSAASALADARSVVELSPPGPNRPFAVIDDGWQPGRGAGGAGCRAAARPHGGARHRGGTAAARGAARLAAHGVPGAMAVDGPRASLRLGGSRRRGRVRMR